MEAATKSYFSKRVVMGEGGVGGDRPLSPSLSLSTPFPPLPSRRLVAELERGAPEDMLEQELPSPSLAQLGPSPASASAGPPPMTRLHSRRAAAAAAAASASGGLAGGDNRSAPGWAPGELPTGGGLVPPASDPLNRVSGWDCRVCTLHNATNARVCAACSVPRPSGGG